MGDQDVIQTICGVLTACYRFRKFTESRWLTIGASTRVLTVGVLMGLDSLVDFIKEDGWWCLNVGERSATVRVLCWDGGEP